MALIQVFCQCAIAAKFTDVSNSRRRGAKKSLKAYFDHNNHTNDNNNCNNCNNNNNNDDNDLEYEEENSKHKTKQKYNRENNNINTQQSGDSIVNLLNVIKSLVTPDKAEIIDRIVGLYIQGKI